MGEKIKLISWMNNNKLFDLYHYSKFPFKPTEELVLIKKNIKNEEELENWCNENNYELVGTIK